MPQAESPETLKQRNEKDVNLVKARYFDQNHSRPSRSDLVVDTGLGFRSPFSATFMCLDLSR